MSDTVSYRVLARKYRPQTFADLIGQEAMVRTLTNAFATGRIAQAYMLTGVRGVGKTTTARILARALNYEAPGVGGPTLDMPVMGTHCQAIMESRHVDVLEMDAASHTSINDIREITEAARYRPISARYKVYIIDEVHMLSQAAFNGLLKTLEEPPEHVKFIFATTEIRKVPVTILSRCQRFDLRRVDAARLVAHLRNVLAREGAEAEDEALALIARAGEGSVRDALSLLDQAIAHGQGRVEAESVRAMLGLADRSRIVELFERLMRGDAAGALAELKAQHESGADPGTVLTELAAFTHLVTKLKLAPGFIDDPALTEVERVRGRDFADRLSLRVLSRAWQMLLKGIGEVQAAPQPLAAADMVLVRLAHAADLPTPDEALKALAATPLAAAQLAAAPPASGALPRAVAAPASQAAPAPQAARGSAAPRLAADPDIAAILSPGRAAPRPVIGRIEDLVALAQEKRDIALKVHLERHVRPVRIEPGRLEISLTDGAPASLAGDLGRKLGEWTGERWTVTLSTEPGAPTLKEREEAERRSLIEDVRKDPVVAAVLERFPGAEIVDVKTRAAEPRTEAAANGISGEDDAPRMGDAPGEGNVPGEGHGPGVGVAPRDDDGPDGPDEHWSFEVEDEEA